MSILEREELEGEVKSANLNKVKHLNKVNHDKLYKVWSQHAVPWTWICMGCKWTLTFKGDDP